MGDPSILYYSGYQAWVAHLDPPWFLGFHSNPMAKEAEND